MAGSEVLRVFIILTVILATLQGPHAWARDIERGEELFNEQCSGCHGPEGKGTDKGPPLVHRVYHPDHHGDFSFHLAVKSGVRAHHWGFGDMPPVKDLSPEDTEHIIGYVRSLQKAAGIF